MLTYFYNEPHSAVNNHTNLSINPGLKQGNSYESLSIIYSDVAIRLDMNTSDE